MNGLQSLGHRIMQRVSRHRRRWPVRLLGRACYLFYRGYENRNFDSASNGEEWCLRSLSRADIRCVLDVGANIGDWTRLARQYFPAASIHSFEIVPQNMEQLRRNAGHLPGVVLNGVGLSDTNGKVSIHYSSAAHFRASAYVMPDFSTNEILEAQVIRGDDYAQRNNLDRIDFLKIDVEGMEGAVLRGFQRCLEEKRIRVIQFEYNTTNIVSGFLLRHAYQMLEPLGYSVGKLYPTYVEFRPYDLAHEDFCGPNFIAIRKDDAEVRALLE